MPSPSSRGSPIKKLALLLLLLTAMSLSSPPAGLTTAVQTTTNQRTPATARPSPSRPQEDRQSPRCPGITVTCPRSVAAGKELSCSVGKERRGGPKYFWSVSAGTITRGNGTPEIRVSTAGVREESMTVKASLPQFKDCSDEVKVNLQRDEGLVTPPTPEVVCPRITMKCPSSVVTGADVSCSVDLSGGTQIANPRYSWSVTPRRRIQGQGSPAISVSTAGVRDKLTVRLSLPQFGRNCGASSDVLLEEQDIVTAPTPEPVCPEITLRCPGSVVAGENVSCSVDLRGGTPNAIPKYSWAVSPGNIIQGQGTARIVMSTADVRASELTVTLNVEGFRRSCGTNSSVLLQQPENRTASPTPSPTPTHPPTPAASPTVGAIVTPSPEESVSPGPVGVLTSNGDRPIPWLWILIAIGAIGALALLIKLLGRMLLKNLSGGSYSAPASAEVEEREQRLDAMILGAKKKEEDEVSCTVFAPHEAARGDGFLVQAFAHLENQRSQLIAIAKRADIATGERASEKLGTIERGQELGFHLQMPGLDIDEPQQLLVWAGEITWVKFGVTIPEDFKPRSINCKLSVTRHNVPIGHIRFNFKIAAAPQADEVDAGPEPHADFVRYKLAFISYASTDRSEVLKRVQMLDLAKIRYFQDLLSIEAGKQWEPLIYRYIDECDVFYLFWSTAAKKSKWVKKEVQRALKRKGDKLEAPPEIMPVPIEGPPPIAPPPYLASIQFDSKFLYFINPRDNGSSQQKTRESDS